MTVATKSSLATDQVLDHLFRREYSKIVAHLASRYGTRHLELIEDAVQEALMKAMQTWPFSGTPGSPSGWIFRVAKNQLIDQLRRGERIQSGGEDALLRADASNQSFMRDILLDSEVEDDQLRMIFACCHPALSTESQIILTLKLVCGFGRTEIATALLKKEDAVAKSFTRARKKLKEEVQELQVPSGADLEQRLQVVFKIVYLLFNEGYAASAGDQLIKSDICMEAIRLVSLLRTHPLCRRPESSALLALMHFHAARFEARIGSDGEALTLEKQDRARWDRSMIELAEGYLQEVADTEQLNEYFLQAVLAWYHCSAPRYEDTDWQGILEVYDTQVHYFPSPIVSLNRVVAVAKAKGAQTAVDDLEVLEDHSALKEYSLLYAIKAELYGEMDLPEKAKESLHTALKYTQNQVETRHLQRKLATFE